MFAFCNGLLRGFRNLPVVLWSNSIAQIILSTGVKAKADSLPIVQIKMGGKSVERALECKSIGECY